LYDWKWTGKKTCTIICEMEHSCAGCHPSIIEPTKVLGILARRVVSFSGQEKPGKDSDVEMEGMKWKGTRE